MSETIQPAGDPGPFGRLAAIACWGATMLLGFACLVYAREVGLALVAVAGLKQGIVALMDKVGFFLFGAAGLVIILTTEPYYRRGVERGLLGARFLKVCAAGFLVLGASWACLNVTPGLTSSARPSPIATGACLAVGLACAAGARRLLRP